MTGLTAHAAVVRLEVRLEGMVEGKWKGVRKRQHEKIGIRYAELQPG